MDKQKAILLAIVTGALAFVVGIVVAVAITAPRRSSVNAEIAVAQAETETAQQQHSEALEEIRQLQTATTECRQELSQLHLKIEELQSREYKLDEMPTRASKSENHELLATAENVWETGSHFGRITTVWISDDTLKDENMLAQVLHNIREKHENRIVWFFNSKDHIPQGVPMTDQQMLHWVGLYDPAQSETFSYIEITNPASSPPEIKTVNTGIRPGHVE